MMAKEDDSLEIAGKDEGGHGGLSAGRCLVAGCSRGGGGGRGQGQGVSEEASRTAIIASVDDYHRLAGKGRGRGPWWVEGGRCLVVGCSRGGGRGGAEGGPSEARRRRGLQ